MKKYFGLLLSLVVLLSLFGCAASGQTEAGNTGAAQEEPAFTLWSDTLMSYRYTGTGATVALPETGITLNLPDEWTDEVTVVWAQSDGENEPWEAWVINNELITAHAQQENVEDPYALNGFVMYDDCMLHIIGIPKSAAGIYDMPDHDTEYRRYLGEDETHAYYFETPEMWNPEDSAGLMLRTMLVESIGEEAYQALVGDLIVTEDMARQMITINDPVE